jgi:hypothetical protein
MGDALTENPFDFQITKAGTVLISRAGRQVAIVGGSRAVRLIAQLEAGDVDAQQQALARITGNYRRGNEKRPTR